MKIPMVYQKPMIDFNPFMKLIEDKYGFDYRDMAGKYSDKNPNKFGNWCDRKGYGQYDSEGKHRGSSQIWYKEYQEDESVTDVPYLDGWHYFLSYHFDDLCRGGANYMRFEYNEDSDEPDFTIHPDWIQPVYKAIYNEVKEHEAFDGYCVCFHIDW